MSDGRSRSMRQLAATMAVTVGLVGGGYAIASAAGGSGAATSPTTTAPQAAPHGSPPGATAQNPWGAQRSDETVLTGEAATKVTQAAQARVSGGTVVRVETDADGNAFYEAHMTRSDGTPVTVYVNKQFEVTGVQTR